jgi:hypothetical protein
MFPTEYTGWKGVHYFTSATSLRTLFESCHAGRLAADEGTVAMAGFGGGATLRDGMKVWNGLRGQDLTGQQGTFGLPVRLDENEMQNGVQVQVGTWKILEGTGAYSGVSGGGRYVSLRMLNGRQFVRQEGWVRR